MTPDEIRMLAEFIEGMDDDKPIIIEPGQRDLFVEALRVLADQREKRVQ